jgi:branched-chain amino acid transport system substrate-binding protein
MTFSRRSFLAGSSALAMSSAPIIGRAQGNDKIIFASILDLSGGLDIYGAPMAETTKMAIDDINDAGGLLGREVELKLYDAQSTIQFYTQYATQAAAGDRAHTVHGGITSASREAIRPTLARFKSLYFYNTQYEGGVCDYNNFCTGSTPAQTVAKVVPYAMNKWGKKGLHCCCRLQLWANHCAMDAALC